MNGESLGLSKERRQELRERLNTMIDFLASEKRQFHFDDICFLLLNISRIPEELVYITFLFGMYSADNAERQNVLLQNK